MKFAEQFLDKKELEKIIKQRGKKGDNIDHIEKALKSKVINWKSVAQFN